MDYIREIVGSALDIAAHCHSASWEDMDADDFLLIGIGLTIFIVAFAVYARCF